MSRTQTKRKPEYAHHDNRCRAVPNVGEGSFSRCRNRKQIGRKCMECLNLDDLVRLWADYIRLREKKKDASKAYAVAKKATLQIQKARERNDEA